jgi:hypothetical protein
MSGTGKASAIFEHDLVGPGVVDEVATKRRAFSPRGLGCHQAFLCHSCGVADDRMRKSACRLPCVIYDPYMRLFLGCRRTRYTLSSQTTHIHGNAPLSTGCNMAMHSASCKPHAFALACASATARPTLDTSRDAGFVLA